MPGRTFSKQEGPGNAKLVDAVPLSFICVTSRSLNACLTLAPIFGGPSRKGNRVVTLLFPAASQLVSKVPWLDEIVLWDYSGRQKHFSEPVSRCCEQATRIIEPEHARGKTKKLASKKAQVARSWVILSLSLSFSM